MRSGDNKYGPYLFARAEQVLPEEEAVAEEVKNNKKRGQESSGQKTRDILADRAGVSPEIIRQVKKVLEFISDEVVLDMCRSGQIKVHNAYQLVKMSETERAEAIEKIHKGEDIKDILATLKRNEPNGDMPILEYMGSAQKVMGHINAVWKYGEETPASGNLFADFSRERRNMVKQLELTGVTERNSWEQWVIIVPAMSEAGWFQKLCQKSDGLCLVEGRKLAVFYYGTHGGTFVESFVQYGFCV